MQESALCRFFVFRINSVAYGTVGNATKFIYYFYRFLDIVEVVESVKNTHYVQAVFYGLLVKPFYD